MTKEGFGVIKTKSGKRNFCGMFKLIAGDKEVGWIIHLSQKGLKT
jgi:hypothetical protein